MTDSKRHLRFLAQAGILVQAIPFMQRYQGQVIVIKLGGNAMSDMAHFSNFARDVMLLKQVGIKPIIIHGGGPQINEMLEKLNIAPKFIDGLRVTDKPTMDVVAMVLTLINKQIVAQINMLGGNAVGLTGVDGNLLRAKPVNKKLGFAGRPEKVDISILETLHEHSDAIPVIAPLSIGANDDGLYNVNGDVFAGAIAMATQARRLIMLTDIEGVLDENREVIHQISVKDAKNLIKKGVISGGMIPKLETCMSVVEAGVRGVAIVDGRFDHSILLELFTEAGHGTLLRK